MGGGSQKRKARPANNTKTRRTTQTAAMILKSRLVMNPAVGCVMRMVCTGEYM